MSIEGEVNKILLHLQCLSLETVACKKPIPKELIETATDAILKLTNLTITCDFCHNQLTELGGLLFSPPDGDKVVKKHLCRSCFGKLTNLKPLSEKELADKIVNTVNKEFNLNLLAVDSFAMSESIIQILKGVKNGNN